MNNGGLCQSLLLILFLHCASRGERTGTENFKLSPNNKDLRDITSRTSSFNWKWVILAQMTYRLVVMKAPSCGSGKKDVGNPTAPGLGSKKS